MSRPRISGTLQPYERLHVPANAPDWKPAIDSRQDRHKDNWWAGVKCTLYPQEGCSVHLMVSAHASTEHEAREKAMRIWNETFATPQPAPPSP